MITALLPPDLAAGPALFLVAASFFTSALTAAFALGGGIALLALLSLFLPVAILIPLHGLVQLGSNAGRVAVQFRAVAWRRLWPFIAGAVIGALIGAQFVVTLPEDVLRVALGLFMLVVVFVKLPRLGALPPAGFAAAGMVTTFLSMFFGATGPINVAIFSRTFDDRVTLVGTLAAATSTQHLLKAIAFFALGVALGPYAPFVAAMLVTGFLGTLAGTAFLKRLPERWFRLTLTAILTVVALDLLWEGLPDLIS